MGSAETLYTLMNQLQNLESSLTHVLIEAALKLTSLTESNVFFLVETPEGRRFAGSSHLCHAFNRGGLVNSGEDLELELEGHAGFSLKVKPPPPPPPPPRIFSSQHPRTSAASLPSSGCVGRKRSSPTSLTDVDGANFRKLVKVGDDDDDDDPIFIEDDSPALMPEESAIKMERLPTPIILADGGGTAAAETDVDDDLSWIESKFTRGNHKWEFIVAADESTDFSKNSVARRVLDSLLCDVGRRAGARSFVFSPQALLRKGKTHAYLDAVFQRFCSAMPNLNRLEGVKVEQSDDRAFAFKVHMRSKMSMGYGNVVRRQNKRFEKAYPVSQIR